MATEIAHIDPARCTGCGRCISACELRLIAFETKDWKKRSVLQEPARCTGCGDCAAICPVDAISMADAHQVSQPIERGTGSMVAATGTCPPH